MLEVFATSRAIRSFYTTFIEHNTLLPKAISIAELEQKAILVPHHALADEDKRVLLMQEASAFAKFELLYIEREFFTFLKNSTYLFRFFEELAFEKIAINSLQQADTYEHYNEHLEILQTLLGHYEALLAKHGLYDRITLPKHYEINESYVRSQGSIRIHLEGFLSRFEMEIFAKIATITPLHLCITLNAYNQKMATLLMEHGLVLQPHHSYEINFSTKEILSATPINRPQHAIKGYGFSSRLAQVAYVQSSIAEFIEAGLTPEEIVVVLPDEGFAPTLSVFDTWHNLNFAMGTTLRESHFYQKLSAIEKALRNDEIADHLRLNRLEIPQEMIHLCRQKWHQTVSCDVAMEFFESLLALCPKKEQQHMLFQEAFFAFKHFLQNSPLLQLSQVIKLLLNRLSHLSFDDTRGGKVTVMGLLETRGMAYKGVIIVDFNDEFVPKRSQKDLFLSSSIREAAGLPTKRDRENLQRYYYHQILSKAQKIAITYVKNDTSTPSRFLDELGIYTHTMADETLFEPLLFDVHETKTPYVQDFIDAPYDLKAHPLSATKLKTLLSCKRQFYFRYIAHLKEAKMPTQSVDEQALGIALHAVLEKVFDEEVLVDEKRMYERIETLLKEQNNHVIWGYFVDVWLQKLKPFIRHEIERFAMGYRIFKKEWMHTVGYKGFILEGKIDRIDEKAKELFIIDYKSGKIPTTTQKNLEETTDFQLLFYTLIAGTLGNVADAFYYDLNEGILVREAFLEEKKERLDQILELFSKPINGYELCEERKHCRLCPYVVLCGRWDQI